MLKSLLSDESNAVQFIMCGLHEVLCSLLCHDMIEWMKLCRVDRKRGEMGLLSSRHKLCPRMSENCVSNSLTEMM